MKRALIIVFFLCTSILSFSQSSIPDTCFTESELIQISRSIDSLWIADSLNHEIIINQQILIDKYKHVIQLDSLQQEYQKQQIQLLQKNIDLYVEREKRIQPKWYDNKSIWFGSGILTTILTAKLIIEVVK
jgi:hypothetical protein